MRARNDGHILKFHHQTTGSVPCRNGVSTNWLWPAQEDTMNKRFNFNVLASAAIIFAASSMPLHAEGLGGLGKTVGGTLGGLGNAVGNTVGAVGNTVNGVTGNIGNTTAKLGALNKSGVLSADAKSDILNGIMAKARVLSPKELARLCLATGGGDSGCGSGNRPRILGIIDARLDVLSNKRLISVCASVGAGCGGSSPIASGGSIPGAGAIDTDDVVGSSAGWQCAGWQVPVGRCRKTVCQMELAK